jgi:hypothetical protein
MSEAIALPAVGFDQRHRTADRVFRGALVFNALLTVLWLYFVLTQRSSFFFAHYNVDGEALGRVFFGILFFYVIWGVVWYAVKNLLLKHFVGFTKEERKQAFSSRMDKPFEVADLVARYSERRIRITDMIGRRGRFITLATAGFYYMYRSIADKPTSGFASQFLQDNLFDAMATGWVFLGIYYLNGFIAGTFYGPQSRVMDGVLGRANCLLITTLWTAFKFVMVPIGMQLAVLFPPAQFAAVFALIWGSYIAADASAEIVGSLFGRQTIKVRGIGDVNRKSVAGTVAAFAGSLVLCLLVVKAQALPLPWVGLAVAISVANTLLELYSPRGTDDFTMATANALLCWGFGAWVL